MSVVIRRYLITLLVTITEIVTSNVMVILITTAVLTLQDNNGITYTFDCVCVVQALSENQHYTSSHSLTK